MMNFGEAESQTVEFSPALPYQGAFFFRTYQARLVLIPELSPRENCAAFIPDNLLRIEKPNP